MIKAEHVTMRYLLANDRIQSLKEYFTALLKGKLQFKEFTALEVCEF